MRIHTHLAGVALAAALTPACSGACDDLQVVCNRCEDPNQKFSCETSVDLDDGDRCERDLSSYCIICGGWGGAVVEECK